MHVSISLNIATAVGLICIGSGFSNVEIKTKVESTGTMTRQHVLEESELLSVNIQIKHL